MGTLGLILAVAAGFIVGVIVLVVVAFLVVRWWVKRKINDVTEQVMKNLGAGEGGDLFEAMNLAVPVPPRVRLQKRTGVVWHDKDRVETLSREFEARGFSLVGDFVAPEMAGVSLRALCDPSERYYAVIYDLALGGFVFCDLHATLSDGTLTVTSAPQGEEIQVAPSHRKIYLKNAPADALVSRMDDELRGLETLPATPQAFAEGFERAYAESMDFLLARGGPTLNEMRRGAELRGETVNEASLKAAYEARQVQNRLALEEIARQKFLESGAVSASRWEELRDRLLVIHDRYSDEDVAMSVYGLLTSDEDDFDEKEFGDGDDRYEAMKEGIRTTPPRQAFARLIADLPPEWRPRLLASFSEPVGSDIYELPATD